MTGGVLPEPEPGLGDKLKGAAGRVADALSKAVAAADQGAEPGVKASTIAAPKTVSFAATFVDELRVISLRREILRDHRMYPDDITRVEKLVARGECKPGEPLKQIDDLGLFLTGMCMSGGGIRSAAVNMGVTQGMDSLSPPGRSQMIDSIDYLSTVSGGNYMGTCLAAAMTQRNDDKEKGPLYGGYPFESKTDGSETPETQRLRNYANYLAPKGGWDILANLLVVTRCMIANVAMLAIAIVGLAALTIVLNPDVVALAEPWSLRFGLSFFGAWPAILGPVVIGPLLLLMVAILMVFWTMLKASAGYRQALPQRQAVADAMPWLIIAALGIAAFEFQPVVLAAMFRSGAAEGAGGDWAGFLLGKAGYVLTPAALALFAFGQKLISLLKSAVGDAGFIAMAKRWTYKVGLALLGLSVPLLIWVAYLNFAYAGICNVSVAKAGASSTCGYGLADWMVRIGERFSASGLLLLAVVLALVFILVSRRKLTRRLLQLAAITLPVAALWAFGLLPAVAPGLSFLLAVLIVLLFVTAWFSPNANTLHQLYRDRLSQTFLMARGPLHVEGQAETSSIPQRLNPFAASQRGAHPDDWTFSSLIFDKDERDGTGAFGDSIKHGAGFAPYLLVNTAVNLQANYLESRGRKADTFTLAPYWSGSDATGYVRTQELERRDPRLTLATGMAISGAAVSANMGGNTIPVITFSLAALSVRLGYWMPNPAAIGQFTDLKQWRLDKWNKLQSQADAAPDDAAKEFAADVAREAAMPWNLPETGYGPKYLLCELMGRISESSKRIYLTDGGHIENLGLYELTKRRCKAIICVDAEADPFLSFPSLIKAQLMMRVDHGVRMDLPWPKIAAASRKANELVGTADEAALYGVAGPHVAIGRIVYQQKDEAVDGSRDINGVIFYIKSSLTGDERDVLRNYKARNGDFPHETTLDQFFSEEQFEVYRALGFHMARGFFSGEHQGAFWMSPDKDKRRAFFSEVREALARIGVSQKQIDAIMRHADAQADAHDKANEPSPPHTLAVTLATQPAVSSAAAPAVPFDQPAATKKPANSGAKKPSKRKKG
jgi:hypothetical protein